MSGGSKPRPSAPCPGRWMPTAEPLAVAPIAIQWSSSKRCGRSRHIRSVEAQSLSEFNAAVEERREVRPPDSEPRQCAKRGPRGSLRSIQPLPAFCTPAARSTVVGSLLGLSAVENSHCAGDHDAQLLHSRPCIDAAGEAQQMSDVHGPRHRRDGRQPSCLTVYPSCLPSRRPRRRQYQRSRAYVGRERWLGNALCLKG